MSRAHERMATALGWPSRHWLPLGWIAVALTWECMVHVLRRAEMMTGTAWLPICVKSNAFSAKRRWGPSARAVAAQAAQQVKPTNKAGAQVGSKLAGAQACRGLLGAWSGRGCTRSQKVWHGRSQERRCAWAAAAARQKFCRFGRVVLRADMPARGQQRFGARMLDQHTI
jgi:hypothetical protein